MARTYGKPRDALSMPKQEPLAVAHPGPTGTSLPRYYWKLLRAAPMLAVRAGNGAMGVIGVVGILLLLLNRNLRISGVILGRRLSLWR